MADTVLTPPPLPDTLQFMQLLWGLAHALDRTSKQMADTIGVTGPQRLVLRVVGLRPGLSAGELAAILHVHPSTLTGVLQRLVRQRLVTRRHDPRDRRRAVLHLTSRGVQTNATMKGTVESAVTRALDEVSPRDRDGCRRVINRVVGYLGSSRAGARRAAPRPEAASA
jgi:MarR family transcriptional regulator, organic hydroperoxide resistance regulator